MRKTTIYFPDELKLEIEAASKMERRPEAEIIREAVSTYLAERRSRRLPRSFGYAADGRARPGRYRCLSCEQLEARLVTLDTSALFIAMNRETPQHGAFLEFFASYQGPLIVPVGIMAEVTYLVETRLGLQTVEIFLEDIELGSYVLDCGDQRFAADSRARSPVRRHAARICRCGGHRLRGTPWRTSRNDRPPPLCRGRA